MFKIWQNFNYEVIRIGILTNSLFKVNKGLFINYVMQRGDEGGHVGVMTGHKG